MLGSRNVEAVEAGASFAKGSGRRAGALCLGIYAGNSFGYEAAYAAGYDAGVERGIGRGEVSGYEKGEAAGFLRGYSLSKVEYEKGYKEGLSAGKFQGVKCMVEYGITFFCTP